MANTNDVFDDLLNNKESYFVPESKKKSSNGGMLGR